MSDVIDHPLVTEKAMDASDFENTLTLVVDIDATKPEIREAVEESFDVEVQRVNTQVTPQAEKKATVRLSADDDAQDVLSRIGVF
ncbi:MAG: 50S ribosomal protein L23 [Halobacteriaceae archaeon]